MWVTPSLEPGLPAARAWSIARRARALSDPRRVQILYLLRCAPATVSELALRLKLRPSRASLQLSILREAGLAIAERRGRFRLYTTDGGWVDRLLGELAPADGAGFPVATTKVRRPPPGAALQLARTCYDHLAGARSVQLAAEMERKGWLLRSDSGFLVTEVGERAMLRRGVDVAKCREARRKLAPGCLDWTERRPHLGGSIGREILRRLESSGFVRRGAGRTVVIRRPLIGWLGRTRSRGAAAPRSRH